MSIQHALVNHGYYPTSANDHLSPSINIVYRTLHILSQNLGCNQAILHYI